MKGFKKSGAILFLSAYLIITFSLVVPKQSLAVDEIKFTPQIGIPGTEFQQTVSTTIGTKGTNSKGETIMQSDLLARYIQAFYNWGLSIVGVIAVLMLMASGIIWLTSAGDSGKIESAKKMIEGSLLGTALLVGSWFLLNTINPNLTKLPSIDTVIIEKVDMLICCDPIKGETKTPIKIVDGKNIAKDGALIGKEVKCGNSAPTCSSEDTCILNTENKYACFTDKWSCVCQVSAIIADNTTYCQDSMTREGCYSWCESKSNFISGYKTFITPASTNQCYSDNLSYPKPGARCGSRPSATCRPKGTLAKDSTRCPDGSSHDWLGKESCGPGYFCCY